MIGVEESMGENVYSCTDVRSGDKFGRTTEALILHIQKNIDKVGAKVADTIRNMHRIDLKGLQPQEPMAVNEKGVLVPKTLSRFEDAKLCQDVKDFSVFKRQYEAGLERTFGIILGQCTPGMMSKLEQRSD
jgi:hypothetical protein